MIRTNNLTYQYTGSAALNFPTLSVDEGNALLICGESGCGKTTLLHLLAGLRKPTSGQIIIDEQKITDLPQAKLDQFRGRHIGIVYQQPYFIESLSILDNLLISPYRGSRAKANIIADRLNIGSVLPRRPYQLSVGQQQRANIARAVMNEPKLILADEPTSALDNKNCTQVIELLREEAATNNAALVIVTHDDRVRSEIKNCVELEALLN